MQLNEILQKLKETEPSLFDKNGELILEKFKAYLNKEKTPLSKESYTLNWLGKSYAKALVHDKNRTFLAPNEKHNAIKENKNSKNLLIQGDNLAVLKHLRKAYRNSVKMIYIDPPYNTGSDGFVYNDDRKYSATQIAEITGEDEEVAERIFNFINRNASSHSAWLTFMYPRLKVARELLKDDGVIFISIDDNEQAQLKMLCDEVFGEENFVGEIIWETATDNNKSQISVEHEYILCFAKEKSIQNKWFIKSSKAEIIHKKYLELKLENYPSSKIQQELKKWINSLKKSNEIDLSGVSHYSYVDDKSVYYPGNSNNTKPGNYTYDIIHPITNLPCKKPSNGWRFPEKTFWEANNKGDVEWGKDNTTIPKIKKRINTATELFKSYYYEDNRVSTNQLKELLGKKIFDNPKSIKLITKATMFTTNPNDLILDFFAGSGTTAHTVMQLNAEDGGNRNYICVQLDEPTDKKSEAHKAGYNTIFEITRERIKRASAKIKADNPNYKGDLGFKEFKLENYPNGYGVNPENAQQGAEQGELFSQFDFDKEKLNTILTTWTVNDGLPLTEPPQEIKLKDYVAYIAENRLYLLHKNFNSHHLSDLLAKLDDMENGLNIEKIIAFGHHFDSKTLREIEEAVHQYKTRKGVQLYWETRYE